MGVVSTTGSASPNLSSKGVQVPRLQVYRPGTGELAGKAFSRTESGNNATGSYAFDDVLAVPGNEVTVINVV